MRDSVTVSIVDEMMGICRRQASAREVGQVGVLGGSRVERGERRRRRSARSQVGGEEAVGGQVKSRMLAEVGNSLVIVA